MRNEKGKFLAIMRIELQDLHEDIEDLIQQTTRERESGALTNYVFLENLALFRNELLGVNTFGRLLDKVAPAEFGTLDELVEHLKASFRSRIKAAGLAEAIDLYLERKVDKARRYVEHV